MQKKKRKNTKKLISKSVANLPYTTLAIVAAIVMVVLFIYQNGNLNIGVSTLTPPDYFTVAIIGVAILNIFAQSPLVKFILLGLVVWSIYPIL